jgi:ammonia channel protein AmtB
MVGIVGSLLTPFFTIAELAGAKGQPQAEAIGVAAVLGYSFAVSWLLMKGLDLIVGVRSSAVKSRTAWTSRSTASRSSSAFAAPSLEFLKRVASASTNVPRCTRDADCGSLC